MQMIRTSKWDLFIQINEPPFKELLLEFLATFSFNKSSTIFDLPNTVQFRLGDNRFQLSLTEFSIHCGFYNIEFTSSPEYQQCLTDIGDAIPGMVWNNFRAPDTPDYDPRMTKGSAITDPAIRYLHRLITSTISGRRESTGVVSQRDLFYLHCFRNRRVPHLGYGFALYMDNMAKKKKGSLCGAPYITRLAKGLGVFNNLSGLTTTPPMMPFDIRIMRSLGFVTKRNGQYIVAGQPPIEPLPQVAAPVPLPTFSTSAPGSSSLPPPAPQAPSSTPPP